MRSLILKIIAAALCAFLAWELILSVAVFRLPPQVNHPALGSMYAGGKRINNREGFASTYINTLGMRGEELCEKQDGEIRILVLGDSFTEAAQVSDSKTFCALLEGRLQQVNNGAHVVNAGRSGASPAYYLHLADFYQENVRPDYTIIELSISDFTEDLLNPEQYFSVAKSGDTFITMKKPGGIGYNPLREMLRRIKAPNTFATMLIVKENIELYNAALKKDVRPAQTMLAAQAEPASPIPSGMDDAVLSWTVKSLKEKYGRVMLLYLPYLDTHNIADQDELERKLLKYTKIYNVDYLNVRDAFMDYYAENMQPLYGFNNTTPGTGHLNEKGHELVANALYDYLKRSMARDFFK